MSFWMCKYTSLSLPRMGLPWLLAPACLLQWETEQDVCYPTMGASCIMVCYRDFIKAIQSLVFDYCGIFGSAKVLTMCDWRQPWETEWYDSGLLNCKLSDWCFFPPNWMKSLTSDALQCSLLGSICLPAISFVRFYSLPSHHRLTQ